VHAHLYVKIALELLENETRDSVGAFVDRRKFWSFLLRVHDRVVLL
jgi:hypothetical protein